MRYLLILILLSFYPLPAICQAPVTKLFIVRHADRNGQTDDLSIAGLKRAKELARILANAGIDSIYATNFVRTKKTAKPLAARIGRVTRIYSNIATLINSILQNATGKRLLIVGHSDTVDDILRQCGCTPPTSIDPSMPASVFDNLFVVILQDIPGQNLRCEAVHMKYGAVTN